MKKTGSVSSRPFLSRSAFVQAFHGRTRRLLRGPVFWAWIFIAAFGSGSLFGAACPDICGDYVETWDCESDTLGSWGDEDNATLSVVSAPWGGNALNLSIPASTWGGAVLGSATYADYELQVDVPIYQLGVLVTNLTGQLDGSGCDDDCYQIAANPSLGELALNKFTNGSYSNLDLASSVSFGAGSTYRVKVKKTSGNFEVWINGTSVLTHTDTGSVHGAGYIGLQGYSNPGTHHLYDRIIINEACCVICADYGEDWDCALGNTLGSWTARDSSLSVASAAWGGNALRLSITTSTWGGAELGATAYADPEVEVDVPIYQLGVLITNLTGQLDGSGCDDDCYQIAANPGLGEVALNKFTNGSYSNLDLASSVSFGAGSTYRVKVKKTSGNFEVWINGTSVLTHTDTGSVHGAGYIGLQGYSNPGTHHYYDRIIVNPGCGEGLMARFQPSSAAKAPVEGPLSNGKRVLVAPNPLSGEGNLYAELLHPAEVRWSLYDITGQVVKRVSVGARGKGSQTLPISAKGLANGIYLVVVEFNEGRGGWAFLGKEKVAIRH